MSSLCYSNLVLFILCLLPRCLPACSTPGLIPPDCNRTCLLGFFGLNCSAPCPSTCQLNKCHAVTGACFSCQHGHAGPNCSRVCPHGFFGRNCSKICPKNCLHQKCDFVKGTCQECVLGYEGPTCSIRSDLINVTFVSVSKLGKADINVQSNKLGTNRNAPVYVVVGLTMCIISTCCVGVCYYFAKGSKSPSDKKTSLSYSRSPGRMLSMPFHRFSDAAAGDDLDPISQRVDGEDLKTSMDKRSAELESSYGWETLKCTTHLDVKSGSNRTGSATRPPTDTSLTQVPEDEPDVEDLRHVWLTYAPMRLNKAANYSRELFFKTRPQYRKIDVETASGETSEDPSAIMSSDIWSREGSLGQDDKKLPRDSESSGTAAGGAQKILGKQNGTPAPLREVFIISHPELPFSNAEKLELVQCCLTGATVTCVADERPTVTFAAAAATTTSPPDVATSGLRTQPTAGAAVTRDTAVSQSGVTSDTTISQSGVTSDTTISQSGVTSDTTISQSGVTSDARRNQPVIHSSGSDSNQQRRAGLVLVASFPAAALTQDRVYAETTEPLVLSTGLTGSLRNTVMKWTERLKTPKLFKQLSIELKESQSRVVGDQQVKTPRTATLNAEAQEKLELSKHWIQCVEGNKHGKRASDARGTKARKWSVNKNTTCRIQEKAFNSSTYDEYDSEDDLLQALNSTSIVIDNVKSDNHGNTNNRGQIYRMSSLSADTARAVRAGQKKNNRSCSAKMSPALSRSDGHTLNNDPFAVKTARSVVGRTPGFPEKMGAMAQIHPASCRTSDHSVGKSGLGRRESYWAQGFKLPSYMAHLRELQTHKQHYYKKQLLPAPVSVTSTSEADSIESEHRDSSSLNIPLDEHTMRNEDGPVQKNVLSNYQFQTKNAINLSDNSDQAKSAQPNAVLVEKSKQKLSNKITFQPGHNHTRSLFLFGPHSAKSDIMSRFQTQTSNARVGPHTESTEESSLVSSTSGQETTSTELTSSEHVTESSTHSSVDTNRYSLVEQEASRERDENILGANVGSHLRDFVSIIPKSVIVLTRKKNPALEINPAYISTGPFTPAAVTSPGICKLGASTPQEDIGGPRELDADIQRMRSQIGVLRPTADSPEYVWSSPGSGAEISQVDESARETLDYFKNNKTVLWSDTDDSRVESRTPESDTNIDEEESCPLDPFTNSSGRVDYDNLKSTLVFDDNFLPTLVVDDNYMPEKVTEDSLPNTKARCLFADQVPNDRSPLQQHQINTQLGKDTPRQTSGNCKQVKTTSCSVIGYANKVRHDSRSVRRVALDAVDISEQTKNLPETSGNISKYVKDLVLPAMNTHEDDQSKPKKGTDTPKSYAHRQESEKPNISRLVQEASTDSTERPREIAGSTTVSSEAARHVSGAVTDSHRVDHAGSPGSTSIVQSQLPLKKKTDSADKREVPYPVVYTTTSSELLTTTTSSELLTTTTSSELLTSRVEVQDSRKTSSSLTESDSSIQNTSSFNNVSEKHTKWNETGNKISATQRISNSTNGSVEWVQEIRFQIATMSYSSVGTRGANRTGHNTQLSDKSYYKATSPNYKPETTANVPNTDNSHSPLKLGCHHDFYLKDEISPLGTPLRTLSPLSSKQSCGLAESPSPHRRETSQARGPMEGEKFKAQTPVTTSFFQDFDHKDTVGSFIATSKEFSYSSSTGDVISATTHNVSSRTTAQESTSDTAAQGTTSKTASQDTISGTAPQEESNATTTRSVANCFSSQGMSSGTDSALRPTLSRHAVPPHQIEVVSPLGIWLHTHGRTSPRDMNPLNLPQVTPLTNSAECSQQDEKHTGRDATEFFSQTENLSERYYDAMEYDPPEPGDVS